MLPMTRAFILYYGLKGRDGCGQPASNAVVLGHRSVVCVLRGLAEFAGGPRHPAELATGFAGGALGLKSTP
jgi:hypothetical protein